MTANPRDQRLLRWIGVRMRGMVFVVKVRTELVSVLPVVFLDFGRCDERKIFICDPLRLHRVGFRILRVRIRHRGGRVGALFCMCPLNFDLAGDIMQLIRRRAVMHHPTHLEVLLYFT